ncbi:MAG: sugar ABC transporter permease [Propionibacteriaceae bacterium]|jgi:cellobiose transport system permease protein|nr:sugar ABC transporter permease [Propionibacteriaceae bacterium]
MQFASLGGRLGRCLTGRVHPSSIVLDGSGVSHGGSAGRQRRSGLDSATSHRFAPAQDKEDPVSQPKLFTEDALRRRAKWSRFDLKASPYAYIAPFFILFAVMGLFPLIYTIFLSTRHWNSMQGDLGVACAMGEKQAAGASCPNGTDWLGNFAWVLQQPDFYTALRNTVAIFLLSSVPQLIIAVILAYLLTSNLKAKTFWRMGVLFPYIIAPMAAGIIFRMLFADQTGTINTVLGWFGIGPIGWHSDVLASWVAVSSIVNFRWIGYNTLVLLAAMMAVPHETLEAAVIDGAGRLKQLTSVILPMIRPTFIFVIITSVIGGLQIFDEPQMYTIGAGYGGNSNQWLTLTQFMWKTGFVSSNSSNMGRAAAISWLLFIVVVVFGIVSFLLTSRMSSGEVKAPKTKKQTKEVSR